MYIFSIIFKIISSFFQSFSIFNIIYILTPIHVGFVNVVSTLFQIFLLISTEHKGEDLLIWIFYLICLIVVIFGTLIFAEIIIINACGLNEYTKVGLLIKEELDNSTPNATLLSELDEEKTENNDSINCSQEVIKTRKPNNTMVYKYKSKI